MDLIDLLRETDSQNPSMESDRHSNVTMADNSTTLTTLAEGPSESQVREEDVEMSFANSIFNLEETSPTYREPMNHSRDVQERQTQQVPTVTAGSSSARTLPESSDPALFVGSLTNGNGRGSWIPPHLRIPPHVASRHNTGQGAAGSIAQVTQPPSNQGRTDVFPRELLNPSDRLLAYMSGRPMSSMTGRGSIADSFVAESELFEEDHGVRTRPVRNVDQLVSFTGADHCKTATYLTELTGISLQALADQGIKTRRG